MKGNRPVGRPRVSEARRRRVRRAASNKFWQRRRASLREQGLTSRGTIRKYELHDICRGGSQFHGQRRKFLRQRIYRSRLAAQGLTCLGKPKRGLFTLTPLDKAWREFRAETETLTQP